MLRAAWLLATSVRDAIMVAKGRPSTALPATPATCTWWPAPWGTNLAGPASSSRTTGGSATRRAVVEKVFYT